MNIFICKNAILQSLLPDRSFGTAERCKIAGL
jgi:hypothetical protein